MGNRQDQPRRWQRLLQPLTSSRAGAWFFAQTLHHIDRPLLRLTQGRYSVTGVVAGLPIVLLTTTGAKSGAQRTVPLVGIRDGDNVVVFASSFGRARHPAWYHNLRTNPEVTLSVGAGSGTYLAREAMGEEREKYWKQAVALYSGYRAYEQRAGARTIPVVVLTPQYRG